MEKKGFPVHLVFVAVHVSLAAVTLIPLQSASKPSMLGYKALCTFSPISTVGLLALAGLHVFLHWRSLQKKAT